MEIRFIFINFNLWELFRLSGTYLIWGGGGP